MGSLNGWSILLIIMLIPVILGELGYGFASTGTRI